MLRIVACAKGERTNAAYAMPANAKSSVNLPRPDISRPSSRRRTGLPMYWVARSGFGSDIGTLLLHDSGHAPQGPRTQQHRVYDVLIAGAATEVAVQRVPAFILGRLVMLLEQSPRR